MAELSEAHKELVLEYAEKAIEVFKKEQEISTSEHAERFSEIREQLNMGHATILSIAVPLMTQ